MSRRPRIPRELASRPFTLEEARNAGLTLSCLKGRSWRRIGYELYCRRSVADDPLRLLSAWRRLLGDSAVFAGSSAAWLHGLDVNPSQPVEIIVPVGSAVRTRPGPDVVVAQVSAALSAPHPNARLAPDRRVLQPATASVAADVRFGAA